MNCKIPSSAKNTLEKDLGAMKNKHLDGYWKGRFFYVTYDNTPLCRLTYQDDDHLWGFAIYKYSTEKYYTDEFFFPDHGTVHECIDSAIRAYNLK